MPTETGIRIQLKNNSRNVNLKGSALNEGVRSPELNVTLNCLKLWFDLRVYGSVLTPTTWKPKKPFALTLPCFK